MSQIKIVALLCLVFYTLVVFGSQSDEILGAYGDRIPSTKASAESDIDERQVSCLIEPRMNPGETKEQYDLRLEQRRENCDNERPDGSPGEYPEPER